LMLKKKPPHIRRGGVLGISQDHSGLSRRWTGPASDNIPIE
jgi:hypothetical protein